MTADGAPEGYRPLERLSPHLERLGPVWSRIDPGGRPAYGLRIEGHHLNNRGSVHGGVISTLADIACGYAFRHVDSPDPDLALTTTHLATTYLGSATTGDWLEATATIIKLGRSVATSTARLHVDGRPIAHATALFHVSRSASVARPVGADRRPQ